jgi:hypothetical protein
MPPKPVKLKKLHEEEVPDRGTQGLSNAGHVILTCSNCRAALMDVWRTRPHEPHVWKLRATCPFCGDHSFTTEVRGGFHQGGFALSKDDEPDEDKAVSTIIESFDIQDDTFVFTVKRAHPDAKPYFPRR